MYGFAGQVDGIVYRDPWRAGTHRRRRAVATGGLADLVGHPMSRTLSGGVDPHLTLEGLRLVWELNA